MFLPLDLVPSAFCYITIPLILNNVVLCHARKPKKDEEHRTDARLRNAAILAVTLAGLLAALRIVLRKS